MTFKWEPQPVPIIVGPYDPDEVDRRIEDSERKMRELVARYWYSGYDVIWYDENVGGIGEGAI